MRPAEVERISPEDVCWEERQVIIRPRKSKTGGGRVVLLRALPGLRQQDCRMPRNWQNRWLALRRAAVFSRYVPDVCRHAFATYHAAYFRNLHELQLEMGHRDVSLLRSRYMAPALRKTAKEFWREVLKQESRWHRHCPPALPRQISHRPFHQSRTGAVMVDSFVVVT